MTIQQLRNFIAVVTHGGFRAAARALRVSQAGLTKSIATLEAECGGPLIQRGVEGITLSARGASFLPHAQAVLFEADRAADWASKPGPHSIRQLALGASPDPSFVLVPAVLADYHRTFPEVAVRMLAGSPAELIAALKDNRIELAVMRLPTHIDTDDLRITRLYRSRGAIMARLGHPKAQARSLAELEEVEWVAYGDPGRTAQDDPGIHDLFVRHGHARPHIAVVSNSLFDTISMLAASDRVSRLPLAVLDHPLLTHALIEIPVRERDELAYDVVIVHRHSRQLAQEMRILVSMLQSFARVRAMLAPPPDHAG